MKSIFLLTGITLLISCNVPQYSLNNIWRLYELNGDTILPANNWDEEIELGFDNNNRFSGFGGCNEIFGSYEKNLFDIKFNISSTNRFCEGKMEIEKKFIEVLKKTNRYDVPFENELHLYKDSVLLAKLMGTIVY